MTHFKKILLALFIAVAAVSSAFAEPARLNPATVIDEVSGKINAAIALVEAGGTPREDIAGMLKQAKDLTKEISANDKVDRNRQKAQGAIKDAIKEAKAGNMTKADESMKEALTILATMKKDI